MCPDKKFEKKNKNTILHMNLMLLLKARYVYVDYRTFVQLRARVFVEPNHRLRLRRPR